MKFHARAGTLISQGEGPPASKSSTECPCSANLLTTTEPAVPEPTTMKSNEELFLTGAAKA